MLRLDQNELNDFRCFHETHGPKIASRRAMQIFVSLSRTSLIVGEPEFLHNIDPTIFTDSRIRVSTITQRSMKLGKLPGCENRPMRAGEEPKNFTKEQNNCRASSGSPGPD
jgi:hypothetical protein